MLNEFDRGLIKWLPFDALTGFKEAIVKLKNNRKKISKPVLSQDQYDEFNRILLEKMRLDIECSIYFFDKGEIKAVSGKITKADDTYKLIYINNIRINAIEVLEVI